MTTLKDSARMIVEICTVFGCGKKLSLQEQLRGTVCTGCSQPWDLTVESCARIILRKEPDKPPSKAERKRIAWIRKFENIKDE